jgi:inner membrane protein
MPSVFSHAIAAVALGGAAVGGPSRVRIWVLGALCAVSPDLDAITSYLLHIRYGAMLGHRGISHSILFAVLLATAVTVFVRRTWPESPHAAKLWPFFFVATASHGLLDAMTNGGLGVAFFAPFSNERYFLPWRPILVSPISIHVFFGSRKGLRVMWSELGWIWLPAALVCLVGLALRRLTYRRRLPSGATSRERQDRS